MPAVQIHGGEFPIRRIFSDEFSFRIPPYQRPYAWETEQATELLDDLLASTGEDEPIEDLEPYFLGNVVLIKAEQAPDAQVVDGQQRLTTLTILLAALADVLPAGQGADVQPFLYQAANSLAGTDARYRLQLRERDADFFRTYVQEPSGFKALVELEPARLSDAQRRIRENAIVLRQRLAALDEDRLSRLAVFLVQATYLVVVSTPSLDSAYRIFSVLNERGLDLSPSDIFKARVLGQTPESSRDAYTHLWEDLEDTLGRDRFAELFSHIRMLFARAKARGAIVREFDEAVFSQVPPGPDFVDRVLVPYAEAFRTIIGRDFVSTNHASEVNELLAWLSRLDNFDWVPPVILFLARFGNNEADVLRFLRDLERLAASMFVRRVDVTRRIERYGRVLTAIDKGDDLVHTASPLQLSAAERKATVEALNGDIYLAARVRSYVLLRLDSAVSSGGATYDQPTMSIEHVLPQAMEPNGEWATRFTEADHAAWVHRLANLVLLTRRKNSQASNYPFAKKKALYFTGAGGTSPFVLTSQVLTEPEWSVAVLERRQAALISTLEGLWRLS